LRDPRRRQCHLCLVARGIERTGLSAAIFCHPICLFRSYPLVGFACIESTRET